MPFRFNMRQSLEVTVAGLAILAMAGVALLATNLPARRAASLDPAEVLKGD